ncbi:Nucleotide-binding, alpha-beta plait [Artemisia annua]|uniref:Nucleotide-binding, alpha-beta plait n=1 Tax=Artemisia annua TaxID=35608 RepID=A0A2U1LP82_ARTAN|nr:Nucleotide-binding, alpha-beta plait [Artemisia annua]
MEENEVPFILDLKRDNRRYGESRETKDNEGRCEEDYQKLASAWYHASYHGDYYSGKVLCLGFPWIVGHVLLEIKSINSRNTTM